VFAWPLAGQTSSEVAHHRIEEIDGGPYLEPTVPDMAGVGDEAVAVVAAGDAVVDAMALRNGHEVW
jgi:hypothetical protein